MSSTSSSRECVAFELSVFTWPGYTAGADLHEAVTQSLVEFAEEFPEAVQLMRGRTFARVVH